MGGVLAVIDRMNNGFHELVFLNQNGMVAEGTTSNIFMVKEKRILTPSTGSGILKGVTRDVVIGLAVQRGLELWETHLTRHEFYNAEECFLTNTSSEILPAVSFDGRAIGNGVPGPVTELLRRDFKRALKRW